MRMLPASTSIEASHDSGTGAMANISLATKRQSGMEDAEESGPDQIQQNERGSDSGPCTPLVR